MTELAHNVCVHNIRETEGGWRMPKLFRSQECRSNDEKFIWECDVIYFMYTYRMFVQKLFINEQPTMWTIFFAERIPHQGIGTGQVGKNCAMQNAIDEMFVVKDTQKVK
jgi:hypothetical protein